MKKWLIRITAALCSLVLLLLLGGFYLFGTERGTHFLVSQAEKQLDGSLHIGTAKGKVLDRLELTGVFFASPTVGKLELGHLIFDWKPSDLLRLHLHILEVTADGFSYTAASQEPEAPEPEDTAPLILPELSLPITVNFAKLAIHNFAYFSSPDAEAVTVENADLALLWDKDTIQLQKLDVTMKEASLRAQGQVKPLGDYPLQLTTHLQTLSPDLPALTLFGQYSGDLQELAMQQQLSGDASADLHITVQALLNDLSWHGELEIKELYPAAFSPDIPGVLQGKLNTQGNLQQAAVTADLTMHDESAVELNWNATLSLEANLETMLLNVKQLTLKHTEAPALITLTGSTDGDQHLDLDLHWQELQWPVTGKADYSSTQGEASLTGSLENYHLTLQTEVTGALIPEGTLQLTADGNSKGVNHLQLSANLLEGSVATEGTVQWEPAVQWQLSSTGKDINPGLHFTDWPGKLDWLITSDGNLADAGVVSNVMINHIQGTLRELPIAGKGELKLSPDHITINDFRLSSGSAVFTAQGTLAENSMLHWKADVADFSDLLPDSSGTLKGSGTVQGAMTQPKIDLQLSGSALAFSGVSLEQIKSDANLDLSWAAPFSVNLRATNLTSEDNLIAQLGMQAKGTREEHVIHLTASHAMADIAVAFKGGYLDEKWQGLLDTFDIESTDLGTWQLEKPSKLAASAIAANIEDSCLKREDADLCVTGSWDVENTTTGGGVELNGFSLAWLSPWFPETLEDLSGTVSLKAAATMQDKLQADVNAEISPGIIDYGTLKKEGQLSHEGMKLNLHIADDALETDFLISVDSNTISGNLHSPDLFKPDGANKATLDGNLLIDAKKFDLLETLIPDVQDLDAVIAADFKVQGTLEQPDINGTGKLNISHILIPVAGLELSDTSIDILADNKDLKLNGIFNSPKGSLALDGYALLDSSQNWPARFTLKGDNFRLVNLPEIQIFLSSDLLLKKEADLISLTGEATIPNAEVLLRDLPQGTVTASSDVVIVQEMQEEEQTSPLKMHLKVTLGKDVHFAGFGVNAFIDGQLTIQSEPGERMLGSGALHIKQGSYRAYGQDLDIETGVISFPGGPLSQPGINLRAAKTEGDIVAGIYAIGPASKPRLTTFSNPPMPESNVISYLLTGASPDNVGKGAKLSIGRQINNKLSVAVETNVKTGDSEFIARYRLNRKIHVQTTTGANSNAADIFYTIELAEKEDQEAKEQ